MNKTTEALKLAEEALHNTKNALLFVAGNSNKPMCVDAINDAGKALAAIREALADHIPDTTKMIGCAYCDNPLFAGKKCNNCGRVTLAESVNVDAVNTSGKRVDETVNNRHEPVKQEPVAIGNEWKPCMKLPIVVHVREQREGETHVSTREGITPILPTDLIMRGVAGEEYPIGYELFNKTYTFEIAAPVDAKAIRAEALEEAAKVCERKAPRTVCAAAIRRLKSNNH